MLCEGIVIYLQLVNVYTGLALGGRHLKMFFLIGWGKLYKDDTDDILLCFKR